MPHVESDVERLAIQQVADMPQTDNRWIEVAFILSTGLRREIPGGLRPGCCMCLKLREFSAGETCRIGDACSAQQSGRAQDDRQQPCSCFIRDLHSSFLRHW